MSGVTTVQIFLVQKTFGSVTIGQKQMATWTYGVLTFVACFMFTYFQQYTITTAAAQQ